MYQPTEQELLEMGFKKGKFWFYKHIWRNGDIDYWEQSYYGKIWTYDHKRIQPSSKSDIETLIRLFSKP